MVTLLCQGKFGATHPPLRGHGGRGYQGSQDREQQDDVFVEPFSSTVTPIQTVEKRRYRESVALACQAID